MQIKIKVLNLMNTQHMLFRVIWHQKFAYGHRDKDMKSIVMNP